MFGQRRSPKIFCVQKASYNSISVREITGFHSSMILPTLMVFNQAQNDKTYVINYCEYNKYILNNYTLYIIICMTYMYNDIDKPDIHWVKR